MTSIKCPGINHGYRQGDSAHLAGLVLQVLNHSKGNSGLCQLQGTALFFVKSIYDISRKLHRNNG